MNTLGVSDASRQIELQTTPLPQQKNNKEAHFALSNTENIPFFTEDKPALVPATAPTWHQTGDVLSDLGTLMILLMRLGVELREQKRTELKIQHDSAIHHMLKGAEELKKAAAASFAMGAMTLAISVVTASVASSKQRNASNIKTDLSKTENTLSDLRLNGNADANRISALKSKAINQEEAYMKASQSASLWANSMMPMSNFLNGISGGANQYFQALKAIEDAKSQEHSKVSDLASQDYQHFDEFFKDVLSLLQSLVSEMNQAVKSATQV